MAKFCDYIGFTITGESTTQPGVWANTIEKRKVYGDIIKNTRRYENPGQVNDNINLDMQISIIADSYVMKNLGNIKFVKYMDTYWSVKSVTREYPRLILNIGGVYNGETN